MCKLAAEMNGSKRIPPHQGMSQLVSPDASISSQTRFTAHLTQVRAIRRVTYRPLSMGTSHFAEVLRETALDSAKQAQLTCHVAVPRGDQ